MKDQLTLTTLDNGVKLLTYNIPYIQSVHVHTYAKGGSIMEDPHLNGLAHFMEHMLLQGTPTYESFAEIAKYIESMAGYFNATTNETRINFYVTLPFIHAKKAIDLAYDIWTRPTFPEESFSKEKRAVLSEAVSQLDSRGYKIQRFISDNRYKDTAKLRQFTIGEPEIIEKITLDDVKVYWKKYFNSDNTYVIVVGKIDTEEIQKYVQETFGTQPVAKTPELFTTLLDDQFAPSGIFIRHDPKLQSNYLDISFPSIPLESERRLMITQNLARIVLGGLTTSRLQTELRWKKGLVYRSSASYSADPHVGSAGFSTEMQSEHFEEVVKIMSDIISEYIKTGPTDEELEHIKSYIRDSTYMTFDEPSDVVGWFVREFLWKTKVLLPEDTLKLMEPITKEDIATFMHEKWDLSRTQVVLQGPLEDNEKIRKILTDLLTRLSS